MVVPGRDWRIQLINAHRDLFRAPAGAPVLAQAYPQCGPGWQEILTNACARIRASLDPQESIELEQIRAKCGTLRIYWRGRLSEHSRWKVEGVVALAEARSATTCEQCGQEGRLTRAGRILTTRCPTHQIGHLVPIEAKFQNIHIVQRVVDGRPEVACRRYDRATDRFVDIALPLRRLRTLRRQSVPSPEGRVRRHG